MLSIKEFSPIFDNLGVHDSWSQMLFQNFYTERIFMLFTKCSGDFVPVSIFLYLDMAEYIFWVRFVFFKKSLILIIWTVLCESVCLLMIRTWCCFLKIPFLCESSKKFWEACQFLTSRCIPCVAIFFFMWSITVLLLLIVSFTT